MPKKRLKLPELAERAGVPYPTAARYAKAHAEKFSPPESGEEKRRTYVLEDVKVLKQIRAESKPGRPPKVKAEGETPKPRRRKAKAVKPGTVDAAAETAAPENHDGLAERIQALADRAGAMATDLQSVVADLKSFRGATAVAE